MLRLPAGPQADEGKRLSVTGKELKDKALRMLFEVWAGNDFANVDQFVSSSHVLVLSSLLAIFSIDLVVKC